MVNNHSRRNKTSRTGRVAPGITSVVQKVRSHHLIDEFLQPDFGDELRQELQEADEVAVELHGLVDWPDDARFLALQCVAGLSVSSFRTGRRVPTGPNSPLIDEVILIPQRYNSKSELRFTPKAGKQNSHTVELKTR